jgi:hypothetical protein
MGQLFMRQRRAMVKGSPARAREAEGRFVRRVRHAA